MGLSIFKIQDEYLKVTQQLIDNGGEITPEIESQLTISNDMIQEKASNYAMVIKQIEYEAEMIQKEIDRLSELKESRDKTKERLKEILSTAMLNCGITEIKGENMTLNFRKSESVEIEDQGLIPDQYLSTTFKVLPNKKAIKEALKNGNEIPGTRLIENQNLQIK